MATDVAAWIVFAGTVVVLAVLGSLVMSPSPRLSAFVRTRRRFILLSITGIVVLGGLFFLGWFTAEKRYEFDIVNLRMRYCEGNCFRERCSEPIEHSTATKLRELALLEPISEQDARWELIKGFKMGVRGWIGSGRSYVTALGAHTMLTPVTLPAGEDVSKNVWVRWALSDPAGAKQFWKTQRSLAQKEPWLSGERVVVAQRILEAHDANIGLEEFNVELLQNLPELGGVETH
jgi:hypothetical protein